jgi:hypothetical protein
MANNKFNLSKGEERKEFNLLKSEKPTTNKFNLSKIDKTPTHQSRKNKSKWWWIGLLLLLMILVLFMVKNRSAKDDNVTENSEIEQVVPEQSSATKDPVAEVPPVTEPAEDEAQEQTTIPAESIAPQKAKSEESKTPATKPSQSTSQQKTVEGDLDELAQKVIRGNYGNGLERKEKLGDKYAEIQRRVNDIYRKKTNQIH